LPTQSKHVFRDSRVKQQLFSLTLTFQSPAVSLRTTKSKINNSTSWKHCVYVFLHISKQTATFAAYNFN